METKYKRFRNFISLWSNKTNKAISSFSKKEWRIFGTLVIVLIVSTLAILQNINKSFMVEVPIRGGEVSEGILGTPRFINPVLAFSDTDRDLASLVYSGLLRKSDEGTFIEDLAESYEISEDGMNYTFILKEGVTFHDGSVVTADDIIFTISQVKDPVNKSPRKANWDGITVEKIDDRTIKFTLVRPYASFLENTTLGILPAKLWDKSPIELNTLNTSPVGSGPFKIETAIKESSGLITQFSLSAFDKFALDKPFIKKIILRFYANEDDLIEALEKGEISQISSVTPSNAEELAYRGYRIESAVLPRVFGLFFNQNQNQIFTSKVVVSAINQAIDKEKIVREVLKGYGVVIESPIPPGMVPYQKLSANTPRLDRLAQAEEALTKDGWKKNEEGILEKTTTDKDKKKVTSLLAFSISTGNAPELVKSAELIAQDLLKIGIFVDVKTFEIGNLNQSVIRPRKYDALLFGQIINNESDLFAFWHSSQRKDPGLNVALYTNATADKLLEEASVTVNEEARINKYVQFEREIEKDMPAIFLYSPKFIYIVSKNLEGLSVGHLTTPQDRFANSYLWYTVKDSVWKIFSN